ncbi:YodC family protein [Parerythrobacter aestuarii]|uniref:YodC family protein n=1 Tax=Parerythrobacter aestuarii TaxID=3020909 RepID=UPI0024DEA9A1|nr:DUF2158 domain-containing protein [Parerythrobacter aestuarii]
MSFAAGDVVQLKSGGPPMTIASIDDEEALCVWFDKQVQKRDKFATVLLTPFRRGAIAVGRVMR